VSIDLALFRQVLVNILQNAADYTPEGTRIRIAAEVRPGGLAIEIRDSGPGIEAGELPRLFDKFFRGEGNARSGCGLGLAICRGIVEAHGGRIWAASERGKGLAVTLFLPDGALQRAAP
jgi:two-component system sensor histidine kinase KdpD